MSEAREAIFEKVRAALQPLKERGERTASPSWEDSAAHSKLAPENTPEAKRERFVERLGYHHSLFADSLLTLAAKLQELECRRGYIDPAIAEQIGNAFAAFEIETTFDRDRVDDYDFGITFAAGAIAETGTIMLKDTVTSARLAALAPWIHAALIHPDDLFATPGEAIAQFGSDPSVIWATGPSKTADVEGILIEGVHGPGVQIACLTPEVKRMG